MSIFPVIVRSNKWYPGWDIQSCFNHSFPIIRLNPEERLDPYFHLLDIFLKVSLLLLNISAPQINALTKTSNNIIYALQKHNEHMPSFVSTANKRMDYLQFATSRICRWKHYKHNKQSIVDTARQLRAELDNLHAFLP